MRKQVLLVTLVAIVAAVGLVYAAEGYKDTPMLPGGKWHVHDSDRPQPVAVNPGTFSTQDAPGKPPSDAVVLFDGKDLLKWKGDGGKEPAWVIADGAARVAGGGITTKQEFGDFQLHIEWSAPNPPKGAGQGRGNSGVIIFGRYEVQVHDSYKNPTYADGSAAAIYGQFPPLVNPSLPAGQWQTYDIVFVVPRFKDGKVDTPAYLTVFFNGILVHNRVALFGPTGHRSAPPYREHPLKGSISLQDHGEPVRFRNIWIREIKDYDQQ